jgi:hypothetical protein
MENKQRVIASQKKNRLIRVCPGIRRKINHGSSNEEINNSCRRGFVGLFMIGIVTG